MTVVEVHVNNVCQCVHVYEIKCDMYRLEGNWFTVFGKTRLHQAQQERRKLTGFKELCLDINICSLRELKSVVSEDYFQVTW